jgi:hypothetical protein
MISFIIDGNNLIGKIKSLMDLQKKDKQASREKLVLILDRYFLAKSTLLLCTLMDTPTEKLILIV